MKNLPFVLWLLLFPLNNIIQEYILVTQLQYHFSTNAKNIVTLIEFFIWVYVAILVYEETEEQK
ncbi:MAG: hypothetical protein GY714_20120 [Desulfobacterales bacterium]|nr:hypothetical protein [Desulfobacterales bacterium]